MRNVKRNFTSVLGFGNGFNLTNASQGQVDFGASSVVAAIGAQQPWYYTMANGSTDEGLYLGTANSSGSAIYGSSVRTGNSSPEEFRIWVATNSDRTFLKRAPDLTITGSALNIEFNGYDSFIRFEPRAFTATVGDFNGDGKADLAIKRALPFYNQYRADQRVGIFYGITDKIAAGVKTIDFLKADAWVVNSGDPGAGNLSLTPNIDINRDGIDDLIVGNSTSNKTNVYLGARVTQFSPLVRWT